MTDSKTLHRRQLLKSSLAATLLFDPIRMVAEDGGVFYDEMDLGVASGEPREDSVILWTRIPRFARPSGSTAIVVEYEVSLTADFKSNKVICSGSTITYSGCDYTVNVKAAGLQPGTWYFYRFTLQSGYVSVTGRTKTAPAAGNRDATVKFATLSCQHYQSGFYTAYANLIKEDIDFCIHLGDFIYEESKSNAISKPVRKEPLPTAFTTEQYRAKYRLYLSDPNLREARRLFPFVHIWDDHEVVDDYAGSWADIAFQARKGAAYQAYSEYIPIEVDRNRSLDQGIKTVRSLQFGDQVELFCMDIRRYREESSCTGGHATPGCNDMYAPDLTTLGKTQKQWLLDGLADSNARWKMVQSSVMFMPFKLIGDSRLLKIIGAQKQRISKGKGGIYLNLDAWDGYPMERMQITSHCYQHDIRNVVYCSGDIHVGFGGNIFLDPDDSKSPVTGYEVTTWSISSPGLTDIALGLNMESSGITGLLTKQNPHMDYANLTYHGYSLFEAGDKGLKVKRVAVDTVKNIYSASRVVREDRLAAK